MRATSLSRADNRIGSQPCGARQNRNLNYNDVVDERLISFTVPALPDLFVLGDIHIRKTAVPKVTGL
jgi:hypothetical protein